MSDPIQLDLGSVVGPDAFTVWCSKQDPALDPDLVASWNAYLAAIKGETGDTGAPGADGLRQDQVDARIAAAVGVSVQAKLTFDATPTGGSENPVTSAGVFSALAAKQDTLTVDATPTENSPNPVSSGGVFSAIAAASIGDTGWVAMTLNSAKASAGSIAYRVKNGVLYLAGSFTATASGTLALTTSRIPSECMPSTAYGAAIRVPASVSVWRIADVYINTTDGKLYMGGVVDIQTASSIGSVNVNVSITGCAWALSVAS